MSTAFLSFNQAADEMETAIKEVVTSNQQQLARLIRLMDNLPLDIILHTLDDMDSNLGKICSTIQHLLNVYPTQAVIKSYTAVAPILADYAQYLIQNPWLLKLITSYAEKSVSLEEQALLKQYKHTLMQSGAFLNAEDQNTLAAHQETLNQACEQFEQNVAQTHEDTTLNNLPLIVTILNERLAIAKLFGYDTSWDYALSTKSFADTYAIETILDDVLQSCVTTCRHHLFDMQQTLMLAEPISAVNFDETLQQFLYQKYGFKSHEINAYYPLNQVLDGLNILSEQLFDIHLRPNVNVEVWNPDVRVLEVYQDQQLLGIIYADLLQREHKRGSSWIDVAQVKKINSDGNIQPAILFLNTNIENTEPILLSHDNLVSLLHEFGHCLHYFLSETDYAGLSGTNGVALDEIEIPSLFFERCAFEPTFHTLFARHYQTRESMPEETFDKLASATQWITPFKLLQRLKLALLDMKLYRLEHDTTIDEVKTIIAEVNHLRQIFSEADCQDNWYQTASLLFTGQYAAGYYSYLVAEIVAADLFQHICVDGWIDKEKLNEFRKSVLASGGLLNLRDAARKICCRPISIEAFLINRGLNIGAAS